MICLILVSSLLLGCVPSKVWLYRAVDEEGRFEERYMGSLNISYGKKLLDDTSFNIRAGSNSGNEIGIGFQLTVAKDAKVELEKWELVLSSLEFDADIVAPINEMSVSVYGRDGRPGYLEYVYPGQIIFGRGVNESLGHSPNDSYLASVLVQREMPKTLSIALPRIIINDKLIVVPEIKFELVEAYDYAYSLQ